MGKEFDRVNDFIITVKENGKQYSGIMTSKSNRLDKSRFVNEKRRDYAWIIGDDTVEIWQGEGSIEYEKEIYEYGPYFEGTFLTDYIRDSKDDLFTILSTCLKAFEFVIEKVPATNIFYGTNILILKDRRLLIIPYEMNGKALAYLSDSEKIRFFDTFNHPDFSLERNLSYFLASVIYYRVAGSFHFHSEQPEELHTFLRTRKALPLFLKKPGVKQDFSDTVMGALNDGTNWTEGAYFWREFIKRYARDGIESEISTLEREKLEKTAARSYRREKGFYSVKRFLSRNKIVLIISSAAAIIAVSMGISVLSNLLRPRITIDLEPYEVVRLYYTSINTYNYDAIEDCTVDDVGKGEANMAITMFVTSRQILAYEGFDRNFPADVWIEQGKPDLPAGVNIYGIANLTVTSESEDTFIAEYDRWVPNTGDMDISSAAMQDISLLKSLHYRMKDRVFLRFEKKYWAIYRIDQLESVRVFE